MEEAGLDDFFAKKDKSKKKSKSSKQTPSDNSANPDEPVKKDKKSKKDKDKSQASYSTKEENRIIGRKEEEWKEQEEEKDPDYTGLRIANIQVSEETPGEEEEQTEENEAEEDENGEIKEKKDTGQQGPWKGGSAPKPAPKPKVVEEAPVVEATPSEPSAPKAPSKYVPPSQRAGGAGSQASGPTLPAHLRKKRAAPNLRSEDDFPTLGGGPMPGDGSFEQVQFGGKTADGSTKSSQQLSLGNKFSALQD